MKAIFFDLFETLVTHLDPEWTPPEQTQAERLGIPAEVYDANWDRLEDAWEKGELESINQVYESLYEIAQVPPKHYVINQLKQVYVEMTQRVPFGAVNPNILTMVSKLKDRGYKLAVITNANNLDTAPWAGFPLSKSFNDFIASHEVGLRKPDKQIYQLACDRMAVQPQNAFFVGDGGSKELEGAKKAGLTPLWCSWFIDQWPDGLRPNGFDGDGWRTYPEKNVAPYPRLKQPSDLLAYLEMNKKL